MKHYAPLIFIAAVLMILISAFAGGTSGAVRAQQPPTTTPQIVPSPTVSAETLLLNAIRLSENAQRQQEAITRQQEAVARQQEAVNSVTSLVQGLAILFAVVGIVALLFGMLVFVEYRSNLRRVRDLINQAMDETKQMRVVQEAVNIRLKDVEKLSEYVDKTSKDTSEALRAGLTELLNRNEAQAITLRTEVAQRLNEVETLRRDLNAASQEMRGQVRNELLEVANRGDRQMKALLDVLNTRIRDIEVMRKEIDAMSQDLQNNVRDGLQKVYTRGDEQTQELLTMVNGRISEFDRMFQEVRNQVRDELQQVYERSDQQMKALTEALGGRLRELEALRKLVETISLNMQERIKNEIQVANTRLGDLETVRKGVETTTQDMRNHIDGATTEMRTFVSDDLKVLRERIDKVTQALAMAQTAQQQKSTQALALVQIAQQQIASNNLPAALASLQKAAETSPENDVVEYFLGDVYLRTGNLQEAIAVLQKVDSGSFPQADALYAYALRLKADGETDPEERERMYNLAASLLLRTLKTDPALLDLDGESVYGALGALYHRQGRIDQAIAMYEHAHHITPQNTYPLNNLGLLYTVKGEKDTARRYFEQSRALASQKLAVKHADYWAWYDLITAHVALGAPQEEIARYLETAISLTPNDRPLEKFSNGLNTLMQASEPPEGIDAVVDRVKQAMNGKRQVVSAVA